MPQNVDSVKEKTAHRNGGLAPPCCKDSCIRGTSSFFLVLPSKYFVGVACMLFDEKYRHDLVSHNDENSQAGLKAKGAEMTCYP